MQYLVGIALLILCVYLAGKFIWFILTPLIWMVLVGFIVSLFIFAVAMLFDR